MNNTKMPAIFIAHGAPNIILTNDPVLAIWREQTNDIPTPKAILVISAHWNTSSFTVGGNIHRQTIHDFSGFEKELHEIFYQPPAACQLAKSIANKLSISVDNQRGLDHGAWVPLSIMYPDENIPVVQLSVSTTLDLEAHFSLGKKLSYLRKQGVLIIASGGIVHNLSLLNWRDYYATPHIWAKEFMNDFTQALMDKKLSTLTHPFLLSHGEKSLPSIDHYLPFLVALGASENSTILSLANCWRFSSLSMHSYRFE